MFATDFVYGCIQITLLKCIFVQIVQSVLTYVLCLVAMQLTLFSLASSSVPSQITQFPNRVT